MENWSVKERIALVDEHSKISIRKQCDILSVSRGSFYYKPLGESELNLDLMKHIIVPPNV